ncbi:hypothetical protein BDP27DRAFT_1428875 [Rhodocollybia butyracea]|uniref:Uncharacterized protein n=1 Tax=Rhodocollybia butyracea TaxID=206335 RepID=A0A9P5PG79_9AGAR|nr:hypothetical protein BDP27DRAFT_1428875 [Rhodocollybia butyracea]
MSSLLQLQWLFISLLCLDSEFSEQFVIKFPEHKEQFLHKERPKDKTIVQKTDSDMEISEDEPATSYAKTPPEAMDICADCAIMAQTGLDYPGHNCSPPGFVLRSTTPFSMPDLVSVSSSSSASSLSSENSFSWALSPSIHESDPFTLYHPARNFLQPCPPYNSDNKEWASQMYLKKWKMEKSPVCTQKLQQTAAPA